MSVRSQMPRYGLCHPIGVLVDLVLPELEQQDSVVSQLLGDEAPPFLVLCDLVPPEYGVRLGLPVAPAAAVPKAPVYEHRQVLAFVGYVGAANYRPVVNPVALPLGPEQLPDLDLGGCVLPLMLDIILLRTSLETLSTMRHLPYAVLSEKPFCASVSAANIQIHDLSDPDKPSEKDRYTST